MKEELKQNSQETQNTCKGNSVEILVLPTRVSINILKRYGSIIVIKPVIVETIKIDIVKDLEDFARAIKT